MNTIFKNNRSLKDLIKDYKRQNIKSIKILISEEITILKWRLKFLWLKFFNKNLNNGK